MPNAYNLKSLLLGISIVGLLLLSVLLRCHLLENIPGVNGDEAWYGVQAVEILNGTSATWRTPTGNPLNPLFIGPLILLHLCFEPSIALLRCVAVASGLFALLLNWILCRWVYDVRMAWISTTVLAILPIDIAYSRFAWDASQSLAATLPVVYFSLAAIRFSQWNVRSLVAAFVCQVLAVLVHPTNVFVSPFILTAIAAQCDFDKLWISVRRFWKRPLVWIAAAAICILIGLWTEWIMRSPIPRLLDMRFKEFLNSNDILNASIFYPRLFTGGTIYRYIAGSRSWFDWPLGVNQDGFGVDVVAFWLLIFSAGVILWRSWKAEGRSEDGVLLASWLLSLSAFLIFAGPKAMWPGLERFSICIIAPTIILLCRALALALYRSSSSTKMALLALSIFGWLMLADFHFHYFRFIEHTAGEAHLTFRTAAEEPKVAAMKYILKHRTSGETFVVAAEWWNYWPLKYISTAEKNLFVLTPEEAANAAERFDTAVKEGHVWFVAFAGSVELHDLEEKYTATKLDRQAILDYIDRPILIIFHTGNY
jgi:hypothetical protein